MVSRNPFRVRATEYLDDGGSFLSLFGLGALEIFDPEDMWTRIQIIRSARGGGKTSILRIFSPRSLNDIYESKNDDKIIPIYDKLKNLGAFTDKGIDVLGVTLSLFGNYPILNQLNFVDRKQNCLFFALLTSKIVIATLRSACELKKLEFPDALEEIEFKHPGEPNIPTTIPIPCNGKVLYDWASSMEKKILNIIEYESDDDKNLVGYETLTSLHIIKAGNILYKNQPVAKKTLLMLDDVDKLTSGQRKNLSDTLANLRIPIAVWLAERLEVLKPEELLSTIGNLGREYGIPIILEKFWRENAGKFESLLTDIADRRASWNRSYNISAFGRSLSNVLESSWDENFKTAINLKSESLIKKHGNNRRYKDWFDSCENPEDVPSKAAEDWRLLEILIERDDRKKQRSLFDEILTDENFKEKITIKEKEVSEYYVRIKHEIPYYFGFPRLVKLASSNIQQFLDLASDLFDEMIAARSLDTFPHISAERQEQILKKSMMRRWDDVIHSMQNSEKIVSFFDNMAKFCFTETNLPNSPYGGVTGVAISTNDLKKLQDPDVLKNNPRYKTLVDVLTSCFAHNLLEPLPRSKQGMKGNEHLLMYLNRLICFRYQLPLSYGGWRELSLEDLSAFLEGTYETKRMETNDFQQVQLVDAANE